MCLLEGMGEGGRGGEMGRRIGGGDRGGAGTYLGVRSTIVSETRVLRCFLPCLRFAKTMSSSHAGAVRMLVWLF